MGVDDDSDGGRGRFGDWLVVLLLTSAAIFAFVDRFVLSLLLEPIKLDLALTDQQLGMLNGVAFGIFYAALGLPLGWLADRWSRKGTIITGLFVWSVATASCGYATNFIQLLLARVGVGAGEAGLVPASYAIIHERFSRGRLNLATSVFQVGGFLGVGLSMVTAGYIYAFFMGGGGSALPFVQSLRPWQQTFVAAALPGPFFIVAFLFLRERRSSPMRHAEGRNSSPIGSRLRLIYALLFIGTAGLIGCTYALMSWMPSVLAREGQWAPQAIGLRYGLALLIVAPAGVLAGGAITDRLQKQGVRDAHVRVTLFAGVLALPFLLLIPLASSGAAMLALATCLHLVLSTPMGVVPALIQQITPYDRRSAVSAIYVLACNVIGLGLGPVIIGSISDKMPGDPAGLRMAMFYMMLPTALVAIVLLFWLRRVFLSGLQREAATLRNA